MSQIFEIVKNKRKQITAAMIATLNVAMPTIYLLVPLEKDIEQFKRWYQIPESVTPNYLANNCV